MGQWRGRERGRHVRKFTPEEMRRHDALTSKGWSLTKGQLLMQGREPVGRPGVYARWQLRRAIRCFEQALKIHSYGWSSMWAIGKIYQRLGKHDTAYQWFSKAFDCKPDHPDIAREAGLAAMDAGRVEDGLRFCLAAVAMKPEDPGLVCNLAIAYMMAGNDTEAIRCVTEAAARDPADVVTATVRQFVTEVASGQRTRPKEMATWFPYP